MSEDGFDGKYRPKTLDKVIGQEAAVARLKGIVESGKIPKSILFIGPSSAGKTTLARAFVADLFGTKKIQGHPDFKELNSADARGIDDMRDMLRTAKLQPRVAKRRVVMFDEAQGFTGDASRLLLKPLEEPPPKTLFILGSMEPEKLPQAMKNRCSVFALLAPSPADITKFVKRIVKGEDMSYMTDELLNTVVQNSNSEMRSAAHIMEAISQTAGSKKKLSKEDVLKALSSVETTDDATAFETLFAVYSLNISTVYRRLLDVQNGFQFISKLLNLNRFLINQIVLKGEKHKAVWWSKTNGEIHKAVSTLFKDAGTKPKRILYALSVVQAELVDLKRESGAFQVNEVDAIAYRLVRAVAKLEPYFQKASE